MAWKVKLVERKMPDGDPTTGKTVYLRYCASCHRPDLRGNPPEFPSLVAIGERRSVDDIEAVVRDGAGRMPGHPELHGSVRRAIVDYVMTVAVSVVSRPSTSMFRTTSPSTALAARARSAAAPRIACPTGSRLRITPP